MAPKKPRPTPKMLRMCEQMFFAVQAERDRRDGEKRKRTWINNPI